MADAELCLMCDIIIPEGRQVCPACEVPEREDDMLKKKDRLKVTLFGIKAVSKKLQEALDVLKQAENDYIQLHSFDGDKASVKKDPISSTIEGKVKVERALDHIQTIERIMETEGAERDMDRIKVNRCKGEGQGSCKRCSEKGKGNRVWMYSLYEIEGR